MNSARVGVVAIGRNEGERLRRCLESLAGAGVAVVYVDSGSGDGSVALARSLGAEVVELDRSAPFSAARARNAGLDRLGRLRPALDAVFFVDGDCEVVPGFLDRALAELDARPDVAVVCGRRREQFPDHSVYNRLADLEWDTPVGDAIACGGDALMRVAALRVVGGFDPTVPAGEEPELCQRLRRSGWKVARIDAEMTRHDLALARFGPWWRRQFRSGYNGRDIARRFPGPDRLFVGMLANARNWAVGLPLALVLAGLAAGRLGGRAAGFAAVLAVALVVPLQVARLASRIRPRVRDLPTALAHGLLTMLAKPAIFAGQVVYERDRLLGRDARLIEYKRPGLGPARAS